VEQGPVPLADGGSVPAGRAELFSELFGVVLSLSGEGGVGEGLAAGGDADVVVLVAGGTGDGVRQGVNEEQRQEGEQQKLDGESSPAHEWVSGGAGPRAAGVNPAERPGEVVSGEMVWKHEDKGTACRMFLGQGGTPFVPQGVPAGKGFLYFA